MTDTAATPPTTSATPPSGWAVRGMVEGDWRPALGAAVPILLAVLVGAQVAVLTVWLAGGDGFPVDGGLGVASYLRIVALVMCSAFFAGSSSRIGNSDNFATSVSVHATPLGITALVVATAWFVVRRAASGDPAQRQMLAFRVSAVVTAVMLAAAILGRLSVSDGGGDGNVHADIIETIFGALLVMLAATSLAARQTPYPWLQRFETWRAPARAAAKAVVLALCLGWLATLVAGLIEVNARDGSPTDVLRVVPLSIAYLPNLGQAAAHIGMLGSVGAGVGAVFGTSLDVSLFERHGLSAWYWLFALIPLVAVTAGARSALRADGAAEEPQRVPLAYRVAVPLAGAWFLLALAGRLRFSAVGFGSSVGVVLWQALVLPAAFAGAIGWALSRRSPAGSMPRPSRRARRPMMTNSTVTLGYVVLAVLLAACAALGERSGGGVGPFGLSSNDHESVAVSGPSGATLIPAQPAPAQFELQGALRQAAIAQENYFTTNRTYTDNLDELNAIAPPGVTMDVRRADAVAYCIVAIDDNTGEVYTYDSAAVGNEISEGDNC